MNIIKPEKLKTGGTIGIIAPSGEVSYDKILQAVKYFEQKGFRVKTGKNIQKRDRYLAGTDEERLCDLHNAFKDNEIDAIVCARGGYGALRLIDKIDYSVIAANPKIICGFSDITILNAMFLKKCGLTTISGAMAQSDFSGEINSFTEEYFWKAITGAPLKFCPEKPVNTSFGAVSGILFGGNLATLSGLCGVDFIPDEDFIFFTEDVGEPVYKLDRYFTQLINIPKFRKNVKVVVCGDFSDTDEPENLDILLHEIETKLNVPVVKHFPFGHEKRKVSIPYGAGAVLTPEGLTITDYLSDD